MTKAQAAIASAAMALVLTGLPIAALQSDVSPLLAAPLFLVAYLSASVAILRRVDQSAG